jgi:hypothetical protein
MFRLLAFPLSLKVRKMYTMAGVEKTPNVFGRRSWPFSILVALGQQRKNLQMFRV